MDAALRAGLATRLKGSTNTGLDPTRWTKILLSKVNLLHAIDFRALFGAYLVE